MKVPLIAAATTLALFTTNFQLLAMPTVTSVACGNQTSYFILSDGSLWGTGTNGSGQLGLGTNFGGANVPQLIVSNGVKQISSVLNHALILKTDGSLWGMGANDSGQLGNGTPNTIFTPIQIAGSNVTAIATEFFHSLFRTLQTNGPSGSQTYTMTLWAMGANDYGELGIGRSNDISTVPVMVTNFTYASYPGNPPIAAGAVDSYFVQPDGNLYGMGWNIEGELGIETTDEQNRPVQIPATNVISVSATGGAAAFVQANGNLYRMGDNGYYQTASEQTSLPTFVTNNVTAGFSGNGNLLFIKTDGSLWGTGNDFNGQLGDGKTMGSDDAAVMMTSNAVTAATGTLCTYFVRPDGSLWGVGGSFEGELGDGYTTAGGNYRTLSAEQIYPTPPPLFTTAHKISGTNLQISATCTIGGNYLLLSSTNLAQARATWSPVTTYAVTNRGLANFSVTLTNEFSSQMPHKYFSLLKQ